MKDGLFAQQVCSECGKCSLESLVARPHPRQRPRANISQIQKKSSSASGAPCQADSTTWDAGYGPCPTYAPGAYNNYWCPYDMKDGLFAEQVCSECGKCGEGSEDGTMPTGFPTEYPTMPPSSPTDYPNPMPPSAPTDFPKEPENPSEPGGPCQAD